MKSNGHNFFIDVKAIGSNYSDIQRFSLPTHWERVIVPLTAGTLLFLRRLSALVRWKTTKRNGGWQDLVAQIWGKHVGILSPYACPTISMFSSPPSAYLSQDFTYVYHRWIFVYTPAHVYIYICTHLYTPICIHILYAIYIYIYISIHVYKPFRGVTCRFGPINQRSKDISSTRICVCFQLPRNKDQ